jgi:hypothetical protein
MAATSLAYRRGPETVTIGKRQRVLLQTLAIIARERWSLREGYIGYGPKVEMKIAASLAKRGLLAVIKEPDAHNYGIWEMTDAGRAVAATNHVVMFNLARWRPERFEAYRALVPEVGDQAVMIKRILGSQLEGTQRRDF